MDNTQSIGEEQVTPPAMQQVAPDVASQGGQAQLFQKAIHANVAKKQLDAVIQAVATHLGATTSSRVKNIDTASKKIAQKRLQGRDYGIEDINDMLGARIVVPSTRAISKARQAIEKLADAGVFDIKKQQQVKKGTYEAYHYDVELSGGQKAEIQIHTPQSEAEAAVNHTLRATSGEDPKDSAIEALRNKQAQVAKRLPNEKAQAVTQAIQSMASQQGGQVHPLQSAQLLASVQQS